MSRRQALLIVFRMRLALAAWLCGVVGAALVVAGAGARGEPYGGVTELNARSAIGMYYGADVALSGNAITAAVSDSGNPRGAVWLFRRAIGGAWSRSTRLPGGAGFGSAIDLSADGRTLVVGSPGVDAYDGAAWVYSDRGGGVWVGQRLRPTDLRKGSKAYFGDEVEIAANGTTILVAGTFDGGSKGAVWAFVRSGTSWRQQGAKLVGPGLAGAAKFGSRLALAGDGNFALISGPQDSQQKGAMWAFHRSAGKWILSQPKITVYQPRPGEKNGFGSDISLSTDGYLALVSAPGTSHGENTSGFVYVFTRSGTKWSNRGILSGPFGVSRFGASVGLAGDGKTAFVTGHIEGLLTHPNATWVWTRSGLTTTFNETAKIYASGQISASSNGEVALIGRNVIALGPSIERVAPYGGPTAGGTRVTITGKDIKDVRWVQFGNTRAPSFTVDSPTQVTAVAPPGAAGQVRVVMVTTNTVSFDAGTWSYYGTYTYFEPPAVTSVSPATGPTAGGTTVTITGQNFTGVSAVRFGGSDAESFKVDSPTKITAVSPPGQAGRVDVTVITPGGTSVTGAGDAFTYVAPPTDIEKVISFDDLNTGGPEGVAGPLVVVNNQYAEEATFNNVSAIDYSKGAKAIPNFARSGTVGIEQCVGVEFCATPIQVTFAKAQKLVRLWVGMSFPLNAPLTVQLTARDANGTTVKQASATLAVNSTPTPIRTRLEVSVGSALIKSVEVSVPGGYMNGVAVDQVVLVR